MTAMLIRPLRWWEKDGPCESRHPVWASGRGASSSLGLADAWCAVELCGRPAAVVCATCAAGMVDAWTSAGGEEPVVLGSMRGALTRARRRQQRREAA